MFADRADSSAVEPMKASPNTLSDNINSEKKYRVIIASATAHGQHLPVALCFVCTVKEQNDTVFSSFTSCI